MKKYILLLLAAFFIINSVSALQLSPGFNQIDFSSGAAKDVVLSVVNDEHKDIDIAIFVQGSLNESVSLSTNKISLSASEDSKQLTASINMPNFIEPGQHDIDIVALEMLNSQGSSSAARAVARIEISVPYPQKYLSANLSFSGLIQNSSSTISVISTNLGSEPISNAQADIIIYNSFDTKVTEIQTGASSIAAGDKVSLSATWDTNVPVGEYRAVARVSYDENTANTESTFNVGSSLFDIPQVQVRNFNLGGIAKFEMLVQNNWNQRVENISTQTQIIGPDNSVIGSFKSPSYSIDPLKKTAVVSYWDTSNVKAGEYKAEISVNYGNKVQKKEISIKVGDNSIEIEGMNTAVVSGGGMSWDTILIIIAAVLVVANVAWIIIARKKTTK